MLTYDNLVNPWLSQWHSSSKLFHPKKFSVDNVQFPAHHRMSVKKFRMFSKFKTKNFNLIFRGKSYLELQWSQSDAATHQGLSNVTGVISKLIGEKFKNSLGTINDSVFSSGWIKLCNIVGEVKSPVILQTRFSPGNSPEWIQQVYCGRVSVVKALHWL